MYMMKYAMKRYSVAQVRERLAAALDEAESGVPVVIERRGVRYILAVERPPARPTRRKSIIETVDPAVATGQWTWDWTPRGVRFKGRRRA
jgi:antitoxin (DNA-binding transcriptional repressor) of toxin-antitoxin stability system